MLLRHLADEKPIWCIVDADADGYCSSAILLNYLHRLVPSIVENKIIYTHHNGKQHGIFLEQMPTGVGLVIVPDAGSNDLEAHHILRE
jgi:single-stranded-DNA-specific exonuclease